MYCPRHLIGVNSNTNCLPPEERILAEKSSGPSPPKLVSEVLPFLVLCCLLCLSGFAGGKGEWTQTLHIGWVRGIHVTASGFLEGKDLPLMPPSFPNWLQIHGARTGPQEGYSQRGSNVLLCVGPQTVFVWPCSGVPPRIQVEGKQRQRVLASLIFKEAADRGLVWGVEKEEAWEPVTQ